MLRGATALLLVLSLTQTGRCNKEAVCDQLQSNITSKIRTAFATLYSLTARYVDPEAGNDTIACLNYANTSQPPPCRSIHYVLNGDTDTNDTHANDNIVVYLSPGSHRLSNMTSITNSMRVAVIGSGVGVSFINCGEFRETDQVCDYQNLQVRNSDYVYITGLTFTRCGPITSNLYIALSDYVYVDSCSFE